MNPAKSVFVLLMVVLSLLGQTGYASAQATAITVSSQLPIAFEVFVPCAAGGAGEVVSLSGTLHGLLSPHLRCEWRCPRQVSGPAAAVEWHWTELGRGVSGHRGDAGLVEHESVHVREQLSNHRPGAEQQLPGARIFPLDEERERRNDDNRRFSQRRMSMRAASIRQARA